MDGKTILAVILTVVVITVSMVIQTNNSYKKDAAAAAALEAEYSNQEESVDQKEVIPLMKPASDKNSAERFTYETDLYTIEFDPVGASVSALTMKEHADADGEKVQLVFKGENDHNAFLLYWEDDLAYPILDTFAYKIEGDKVVFSHDYTGTDGKKFTIQKTFEFKAGEYLFAVTVDIIGEEGFTGLNDFNYAYTLAFEPQVGPAFTQMKNNNYDYRRVYVNAYKDNGKTKKSMVKFTNGMFETVKSLKWMSLTSKYFTIIGIPSTGSYYKYSATQTTNGDIAQSNGIYFSRPATSRSTSDTMYFYCGPQLKKYLGSYYSGVDNAWGLRNLNLDDAMESGSALGWLENILKWFLTTLHKVVPNYGIDIILLTLILKFILWPLTKKSTQSTAKMQALQPQMQELQTKYKDNPQKLNQETAELYKKAGVSPLGGCLPLLLQFPILIAFYGLLNKHFELRGAMFIPGWIPDLSVPETVATLGFKIPLLGNEIHLLPIIYTVSMIFSMNMTNTQNNNSGQAGATMKFMTYGMPIMFFFVLYSAPSGLLLYWTVQNGLSMIQQKITNNKIKNQPVEVVEKKEPKAVQRYQERLKKLEELRIQAEKEAAKSSKKNKK